MNNPYKTLHVIPQSDPHGDAWIIGSPEALLALRDSINHALGEGEGLSATELMTSDGDGYSLLVLELDEGAMETLAPPYFDENEIYKSRGRGYGPELVFPQNYIRAINAGKK